MSTSCASYCDPSGRHDRGCGSLHWRLHRMVLTVILDTHKDDHDHRKDIYLFIDRVKAHVNNSYFAVDARLQCTPSQIHLVSGDDIVHISMFAAASCLKVWPVPQPIQSRPSIPACFESPRNLVIRFIVRSPQPFSVCWQICRRIHPSNEAREFASNGRKTTEQFVAFSCSALACARKSRSRLGSGS